MPQQTTSKRHITYTFYILYPCVKKSTTTESNKTYSGSVSATTTSYSSGTYRTSEDETDLDTLRSLQTDDTLNMISSPWSTESWSDNSAGNAMFSSTIFSWDDSSDRTVSSMTVEPKSSSYGVTSPPINTESEKTMTLLYTQTSLSLSNAIKPLTDQKSPTETHSSWTMESYTSTGLLPDSDMVIVKYPWSPSTVRSCTDAYPSSSASAASRKVSRETLATTPLRSPRGERDHITPLKDFGTNLDSCIQHWGLVT